MPSLKKLFGWNCQLGVFRPRREGNSFFFKLKVCFIALFSFETKLCKILLNYKIFLANGGAYNSRQKRSQLYQQGMCEKKIRAEYTIIQWIFWASVTWTSNALFLSDQQFPVNMVFHIMLLREQAR